MRKNVEIDKISEYTGHKGSIYALAQGVDNKYFFSSGDDGVVAKWDLQAESKVGKGLMKLSHGAYALLYIPEIHMLIVGGSQGSVYFFDEKKGKVVQTIRHSPNPVYNLYYDRSNFVIWILQGEGFLDIMDLESLESKYFERISQRNLRGFSSSKDGKSVFIGTSGAEILELISENYAVINSWSAHENSVFTLARHPNGAYLVSGGRDAHLNVWQSVTPYELVDRIPAHNFTINDVAFENTGEYFLTASRDKTLKVWDAYSFELLKVIDHRRNEGHTHSVNRILWIETDNSFISCSDDRRLIHWKLHITG